MSDYLNNIVARVFNAAQLIEPRLPSLFEPLPLAAGMVPGPPPQKTKTTHEQSSNSGTLFETSQSTQPPASKSPENPAPPPPLLMLAPDSWPGQPESSDVSPAEPQLEPRNAQPVPSMSVPTRTVSWPQAATGQTEWEATTQASPEPPVSVPAIATHEAEMVLPKDTVGRESHPQLEQHMRISVSKQPAETTSTTSTQSTPPKITAHPPGKILTKPMARATNDPIIVQERSPTIKITIGRVEVRAISPTQSPASRPAPVRPQPRLSLEDYLKQREEGKR